MFYFEFKLSITVLSFRFFVNKDSKLNKYLNKF